MATVEEPIQLHYKDLIDIALGSTDIGLFNLHLLHTILHCLVVNLNLDATTIEYNGSQRSNIENFFANRASVAKQTIIEKEETQVTEEVQNPQTILVVKDHDREENPCGYAGPPSKMVSRSIPKCKDLLAALKCNQDPTENPLGKMVDLINLTERMTAAEIAIEKLSSIIHDLMIKNQALSDLLDEKNQQLANLVARLTNVEQETNINVGGSGTSDADGVFNTSGSGSGGDSAGGRLSGSGGEGTGFGASGAGSSRPGAGSDKQGAGSGRPGAESIKTGVGSTGVATGSSGSESERSGGGSGGVGSGGTGSGGAGLGGGGAGEISGAGGRSYETSSGSSGEGGRSGRVGGGSGRAVAGSSESEGMEDNFGGGGLDKLTPGTDGDNIGKQNGGSPGGTDGTGSHSVGTQLIKDKPGEGLLKDDSIVELFTRSPSQDLNKIFDQKKSDIFKDFQDMFFCSGGLVTGNMLKHLERDLLRKLHLFKSMVFERLIGVECDLSGTQKEVKHINDSVEDLMDLFARLSKKVDHFDEFEKSSIEQFAMIQKNIHCLMGEREVRRRQIYDLIESIEMVKSIKANQEDLDMLKTQKADKVYVDSKVSIKKFNVIQNDLACSIIQTMEKNSTQDIDMANAVKRIETIIESKIDKSEHNYTVVTLTKRIEEVSDKLNQMIKLRVCPEGAGAVQMLKNVRCITCNDVVQMKMEENNTLPRTAILKSHQFALQVETECRTGTKPKLTEIIRSRYCGGEYTMMEPSEKVPQKTNFYIDANVCPPPMSDVYYIEGNDGALYRAEAPACAFKNTNSSHIIRRKPSK